MALSTFKLNKDHISCSICLDVFKKPRILGCLHTFCCQCLQNYIDQQPDACENRGFNCPICRQFESVPNPTAGWASQMKVDFRVESMAESVEGDYKKKPEEKPEKSPQNVSVKETEKKPEEESEKSPQDLSERETEKKLEEESEKSTRLIREGNRKETRRGIRKVHKTYQRGKQKGNPKRNQKSPEDLSEWEREKKREEESEKSPQDLSERDTEKKLEEESEAESEDEEYYLAKAGVSDFTLSNTVDAGINAATGTLSRTTVTDLVVLNQNGIDVFVVCCSDELKAFWYDPTKDTEMDSYFFENTRIHNLRITKINDNQVAILYRYVKYNANTNISNIYVCVNVINVKPQLSLEVKLCNFKSKLPISCITVIRSTTPSKAGTRLLIGYDGRLVVTDMQGKVVKTLTVDTMGNNLVSQANYMVTAPSGNIIISDNVQHRVVCITLDRELLWKYPVKNPHGVHCDEHSNVFIADTDNKKVIVLSPEGQFITNVLTKADHLTNPMGLYYDRNKARLYVSQGDRLIMVFKPTS